MTTHEYGQRAPSVQVRRFQKNRARLVITLEVEVTHACLNEQPSWRRTAMDVLRQLAAGGLTHAELIAALRRQHRRYTILSEKVEVAS